MEIILLLALILLNGVFSMSEMAVVSARKPRLQQWADENRAGAAAALRLASEPSHFLSTVQVGITAIGVLSGVYGEAALAQPLQQWLSQFAWAQPYAEGLSVALVVVSITVLSLIFGELAPKRLALLSPESIASLVAGPMRLLSAFTYPLVRLLSFVTDSVVRLFGAKVSDEPPVTHEEIEVLMDQGREAGVFDKHEQDIVRRVFALDEQRASVVMTPRLDLVSVRLDNSIEALREIVRQHTYSHYPVVDRDGQIVGLLRTKTLVDKLLSGEPADIGALMDKALYVPESLSVMQLMEAFKAQRQHVAFIVDEYGDTQGMVTVNDVLEALVGDIGDADQAEDPDIVRRDDGSWLMSGSVPIVRFKEATEADELLPEEDSGGYNTLGGLAMTMLRQVPQVGQMFETEEFTFEVVDMDRHRVDKLLVVHKSRPVVSAGAGT